jgi:Fe-S-cluster-containing dehydrogenase component
MQADRRTFLKMAGLAVAGLGLGGGWLSEARGQESALLTPDTRPQTPGPHAAAAPAQTRWAMVVDQAVCRQAGDCTECIAACDQAHNVPHFDDPKTEVKWIWREPFENAFPDQANEFTAASLKGQPTVVLCNHCENPACVRVCPTQATWKRADGIVMTDEHRCIGCRYCMVACPYGSRSFNWKDPREGLDVNQLNADYPTRTRGVVEKCTFCAERLGEGRLPACVEACSKKALIFGNLADPKSEIRALLNARNSIRRSPALGTGPAIYYLL